MMAISWEMLVRYRMGDKEFNAKLRRFLNARFDPVTVLISSKAQSIEIETYVAGGKKVLKVLEYTYNVLDHLRHTTIGLIRKYADRKNVEVFWLTRNLRLGNTLFDNLFVPPFKDCIDYWYTPKRFSNTFIPLH